MTTEEAETPAVTDIESADAPAANDAPVADVNVASSEALSAAFSSESQDEAMAPQVAEVLPEPTADSASPESSATNEQSNPVEPSVTSGAPEVVVTTASAETVDAVEAAVEEVDTSGLTADGRAVNDPRILPKPVTDTAVQTELTQLFTAPEVPPVSVVPQNIPRASNDPRGPKAATAGK